MKFLLLFYCLLPSFLAKPAPFYGFFDDHESHGIFDEYEWSTSEQHGKFFCFLNIYLVLKHFRLYFEGYETKETVSCEGMFFRPGEILRNIRKIVGYPSIQSKAQ